eukprot:gnl/MRDRNA2_/MRDRNA2_43709_c0_seq1.p1 gnl/MRDRNA2_/MRDRNA2_43709_c0~~gnl/MRDRNA2_/MRDRNA2_43709_c0_seq1.p1  ORF type:complete len:411 (-),score=74.31 gnl/MRDRNA2_/MRDRNA2_43709_c0_seq1:35-1267(-)
MLSCFFFSLIVSTVPGTSSLRLTSTSSWEAGMESEDYWGEFRDVFTPEEESALRLLEKKHEHVNAGKKLNETKSVAFVWKEPWGSKIVRGDEASVILLEHGTYAKSIKCDDFCATAEPMDVIVHVKYECPCARNLGNLHIWDPIDNHEIDWQEKKEVKALLEKYYIFAGTSKMEKSINDITGGSAMILPHHHSNFHQKLHAEQWNVFDNQIITIGMAGDPTDFHAIGKEKEIVKDLEQCVKHALQFKKKVKSGFKVPHVKPVVKRMKEVQCDTSKLQPPSVRGDCYAEKMSQFDIAVVWDQHEPHWSYLKIKPPQRLINALAVGIPAVAYREYDGHKDVRAMAPKAVRLASTQSELCDEVAELVANHAKRGEAGKQALNVAKKFSPDAIGQRYLSSFSNFKQNLHMKQSK